MNLLKKTARFVFDEWANGKYKDQYNGCFSLFEMEIRQREECPDILGWIPTIWPEDIIEDLSEETEPGTVLLATYDVSHVKPEDIEKFLTDFGIIFHRADPFIVQPKKTISLSLPTFFVEFLQRLFKKNRN